MMQRKGIYEYQERMNDQSSPDENQMSEQNQVNFYPPSNQMLSDESDRVLADCSSRNNERHELIQRSTGN